MADTDDRPTDQQTPPPAPPAELQAPVRPGYAPAPVKQPGGFGKGFGAGLGFALGAGVVATVVSVLSVVGLIASAAMVAPSDSSASTLTSTVWGDESASGKLRAIEISGTIMAEPSDGSVLGSGTYGYEVADMIRGLDEEDAAGIVLLVNTPGGSVSGSAAMADAVADYQERTGQKVLVHVGSMSASGGVYSTSTADEIWADEGSLVGSIGVISGPFQQYTDVTAIGSTILTAGVEAGSIEQEYLAAGRGKAFGDPFQPMGEEEKAQWMEMINASYDTFVARMVEGRGMDENTIRNEMGAGMFGVEKAQEYKLIDGVKGRDEFFRYAAEQAGLDPADTKVEQALPQSGFWGALLGVERVYGQSIPVEQGAGVTPELSGAICNPRSVVVMYPGARACG